MGKEKYKIVYDAFAGNPNLPDVPDATFTPAETSTYLGLLVDFGWLDAKDAEAAINQLGNKPFPETTQDLHKVS